MRGAAGRAGRRAPRPPRAARAPRRGGGRALARAARARPLRGPGDGGGAGVARALVRLNSLGALQTAGRSSLTASVSRVCCVRGAGRRDLYYFVKVLPAPPYAKCLTLAFYGHIPGVADVLERRCSITITHPGTHLLYLIKKMEST